MITETELKSKITPNMIKWLCELAEGFEYKIDGVRFKFDGDAGFLNFNTFITMSFFPLMLYRAVAGWNNKQDIDNCIIIFSDMVSDYNKDYIFLFENYQSENLTRCECAILDCLINIYEENK